MDRRQVLLSMLGAAGLSSEGARAQGRALARIGVLWHAASPEEEAIFREPLKKGLADVGYVEGLDHELVETYAAEKYERFNANAAKLVEIGVNVIVAVTSPATAAAQRATSTIPIVFVAVADPVGRKFAQSLARPGGNLTGLSNVSVDLSSKRLELLKGAIPDLSRVSLFVNAKDLLVSRSVLDRTRSAGTALGVSVDAVEITDPEDLDGAFADAGRSGTRAVVLMQDPLFLNERKRIARLGLLHGVAISGAIDLLASEGCLMAYGANAAALVRRVGLYVAKILKGQNPGEIPIEEPTRLELVLNLRTAKALGLAIPPALLVQADEVIE